MHPISDLIAQTRRQFLTSTASGIGTLAVASLMRESGVLAAQGPQLPAKAKNCICFFMEGGPSQFDLFSYKEKLNALNGSRPSDELLAGKRFAFILPKTAVLMGANKRTFTQYGTGDGMWFSELVPNLAKHADKICMIQSVYTSQFNHHPAQLVMQCGNAEVGHPTMGAWLNYGLGSANKDVPGYVVLTSGMGLSGGSTLWQSGFLPSVYSGVSFRSEGSPILNLARPAGLPSTSEKRGLDALSRLNASHQAKMMDPEIASRIANYELAFRMQSAAPALVDLSNENLATLEAYGLNREDPSTADLKNSYTRPPGATYRTFARNCLLARKMVESGVRFVNVFNASWDTHSSLEGDIPFYARLVDQPMAALIQDLDQRGLLDETLIIWATEFGRTPLGDNNPQNTGGGAPTGRDHHPDAFPIFMVGGGVRKGQIYGETDDIGWNPINNSGVHIGDLHATILHLFGIDHTQLAYKYHGVDQRLTPLTRTSTVIEKLIA